MKVCTRNLFQILVVFFIYIKVAIMEEDGFVLVKQQKRKGKPSKKPQPPRFDACQVRMSYGIFLSELKNVDDTRRSNGVCNQDDVLRSSWCSRCSFLPVNVRF